MIAPGKIEFREIIIPDPKNGQVLIKTKRIGICGSDIHVYHGNHPYTSYPITQGHEVSGIVEDVGSNVENIAEGDKVTIIPQLVCGECYPCRHNQEHICDILRVMGFQATGLASEFAVVGQNNVIKIPKNFSYEEGAMIEPIAVACHALKRADDIKGLDIIVLGAGPIGNLTAQAAKAMGANSVMITDISDYRLNLAKRVGIDHTTNPIQKDLSGVISEIFGDNKADLILECVGSNATINDAIENARKGTDIIVVGVFGSKPSIDMSAVQDRELRIIGSLMYQSRDFHQAIDLVKQGKIKLSPLMSDHFSFEQYQDAYEYIVDQRDKVMKVFIDINS